MIAAVLFVLGAAGACVLPSDAAAQLRPLDPIDWSTLEGPIRSVSVGVSYIDGQKASLAGTKGDLIELGSLHLTWRFGVAALEIAGPVLRVFHDETVFAEPAADARPPNGKARRDAGDFKVTTTFLLTEPGKKLSAALRVGTRLPTTDNRIGLERDETDFFSTVGGQLRVGPWDVGAEVGLSINTTRDSEHEQVDAVLFALSAHYDTGLVAPFLALTGQSDPRASRDRRGNENIGEVRFGVRAGGTRWFSISAIRGWTPFSPDFGVGLTVGARF